MADFNVDNVRTRLASHHCLLDLISAAREPHFKLNEKLQMVRIVRNVVSRQHQETQAYLRSLADGFQRAEEQASQDPDLIAYSELTPDELDDLRNGHKLEAVKKLKLRKNLSLLDAKHIVDKAQSWMLRCDKFDSY